MSKLKAVILVGGPGIRLRPLTDDRPKPMVPVLNRPFLEHTITHLKKYGVKDIILAMSYLPEAIAKYFGGGERCGVSLTYCVEKEPLGTAGAVKNAIPYLDGPVIILNGDDVFFEMDWDEVFTFHREKKAKVTIFLTYVDNPSAFGVVETDARCRVQRFIEKPPPGSETTNWINAGGYILEPDVLDYVPANTHYMFEKGLFPDLLEKGEPVSGYPYRGFWLDMGSPQQYFSLNIDLLTSKAKSPLTPLSERLNRDDYFGKDIIIHPSAVITPPVIIGDGCRIGPDVKIKGPAVLGRDCRLDEGAMIENAVLGRGCRLDESAMIENAVLWEGITVGIKTKLAHCIIISRAVIDGNCEVSDSIVTPSDIVPLPF